MKIKALISFCGVLAMAKDEVLEYGNDAVLQDLLRAGYVEPVEDTPKRSAKKNESKRN